MSWNFLPQVLRRSCGRRKLRRNRHFHFEPLESRTLLAADITAGLVHHWKFDETSGDTAADSAGSSDGALVNWIAGQPKWEPGRVGGALRFASSGNYVIAQPPPITGSFAISFWLNAETRDGPAARIFTAKAGNTVFIHHENNRGVSYSQNNDFYTFSPDPPAFNTWEHYVVNFNNATSQGVIYRSGAPVAIGSFQDSASGLSWVIGHHSDLSNHEQSLHGALDDFRVYNRVLGDEDIAALASQGTPEPVHQEPVHQWTFDETTGFTAHDTAGGADGVLLNWNGAEPRWEPGKLGGALRFSTADNAVVTSAVAMSARSSLTFWLNVSQRTGINPRIVEPIAYVNQENNRGIGFTSRNTSTFDPKPPTLGKWEHYAINYDTVLDVGTIYRNGVAVASGFYGDNAPASKLVFGHQSGDLGNHNDSLNGLLDDLRVYDRLLAPSEILTLAGVPVGVADTYSTGEDTTLTVPASSGVLANDSDPSGAPLAAFIVGTPANGAVTINSSADGSFTYVPLANFNGMDSFTYRASNGATSSEPVTVTITVTPVNDSPSFTKGPDQNVTDESGPQRVANWTTAIAAGPPNESGQTLTFDVTTDNLALFGDRPRISPAGELTFTPEPNVSGTATVSVVLRDSLGAASAAQTFTINITKPHPWQNNNNALDVDGDAVISAIDAVLIINYLNAGGAGDVPPAAADGPPYLDTNQDDAISSIDAVLVINVLNATGTLYGPIHYRSMADSPFDLSGLGASFWLEDFEDGVVNTPGVSTINGTVRGPSSVTDSVDADDGALDNDGRQGHSFLVRPGMLGMSFLFDPIALGGFPTRAGIVATTGLVTGSGQQIEFYDSRGSLIASFDHPVQGNGTASTDDDRFYGVLHPGGISKIRIINEGTGNLGIEADHLQYGDIRPAAALQLNDAAIRDLY